jgi:uncharacterized repeat protein (TIGR03803 family)
MRARASTGTLEVSFCCRAVLRERSTLMHLKMVRAVALAGFAGGLCACSGASGGGSSVPPWVSISSSGSTHRIAPDGAHYAMLYEFPGGSQGGAGPSGAFTTVNGIFYGTTESGGGSGCNGYGCGTVYGMSTTGAVTPLYNFAGGTDGSGPSAGLTYVKGALYGTTGSGGGITCGGYGCGTVFRLSTSGTEAILHNFGPDDGADPSSALTDVNGMLYGTTLRGVGHGCNFLPSHHGLGCGTVYSITTGGTEKVLHKFGRHGDGAWPEAAALIEIHGKLYGTTSIGGGKGCYTNGGCGTLYSLTTSGTERILHDFAGGADGANPAGALAKVNGTIYGTTEGGGDWSKCPYGCGTVYSMTTSGVETVLYRFKYGQDGRGPYGGLIVVGGTLYGTTAIGGNTSCDGGQGCGTIFSVTTSGAEKVLHRFTSSRGFSFPDAPLSFLNSTFYGTTSQGGEGCGGPGCGIIFAYTP